MKKILKFHIITFFFIVFIYVCKIDSIPEKIVLYNDEKLKIGNFFGISINEDKEILASTNIENEKIVDSKADVKLLNFIKLKEISIKNVSKTEVIPIGQISGLKLYTNGILVVGMSEIKDENNKIIKPYINSNIQEGDRLLKVDNVELTDINSLINIVNKSNGKNLEIEYIREKEFFKTSIIPAKTLDGTFKLGLWVRDCSAGIGTMTFYEPNTRKICSFRSWNNRYRYRKYSRYKYGRFFDSKNIINK